MELASSETEMAVGRAGLRGRGGHRADQESMLNLRYHPSRHPNRYLKAGSKNLSLDISSDIWCAKHKITKRINVGKEENRTKDWALGYTNPKRSRRWGGSSKGDQEGATREIWGKQRECAVLEVMWRIHNKEEKWSTYVKCSWSTKWSRQIWLQLSNTKVDKGNLLSTSGQRLIGVCLRETGRNPHIYG